MGSMGKGQIWINGQSLGRHWPAYKAVGSCSECSYTGTFNENKCLRNCGEASQRWYTALKDSIYFPLKLRLMKFFWVSDLCYACS